MSRGSRYSRRDFLSRLGLAGSGAVMAGSGSLSRLLGAASNPPLPAPEASGIEHIVVVMMENRSFDHFAGWLSNANGRQAGLKYYDKQNVRHSTFHLTSPQNCNYEDPDHSYSGG